MSTLSLKYILFMVGVFCRMSVSHSKVNLVDASSSKNGVPTPVRSVTTSVTAQVSKLIPNSSATNQSSTGAPSSSSAPSGSGGGNTECSLCPLCRKTQLARGCGHKCGFCSTLFCSRCGAKTQVYLQKGFRITDGVILQF